MIAAVPMALLFGPLAFAASAFWASGLLLFRERAFGRESSPLIRSTYRWMTRYRRAAA